MAEFDWMMWVVIPALIFTARLIDVTMATLRQILIIKGHRRMVPFIGFVEIMIWLAAISQVMENMANPAGFLAFGLGFAAGNYLGMVIEEKVALGHQVVRIITQQKSPELTEALIDNHFGVTMVPGKGARGPVDIFFVAVERKRISELIRIITECDPNLFYTIEDIRSIAAGTFARGMPKTALPSGAKRK